MRSLFIRCLPWLEIAFQINSEAIQLGRNTTQLPAWHDELPTRLIYIYTYIRTAPFPAALFRVSEQRTIHNPKHDDLCDTDKQLVSAEAVDTNYLGV